MVGGYQMKTQCLLKRNEYHTTAWVDSEVTKLGLLVEIPELRGLWEIVEIYPHRLNLKRDTRALQNSFQLEAGFRAKPRRYAKPA
jgi:hypothetical protein